MFINRNHELMRERRKPRNPEKNLTLSSRKYHVLKLEKKQQKKRDNELKKMF